MTDFSQKFSELKAPGLEVVEALARATLAAMPEPFRGWLADVVVQVEDFADDDVLDDLGIEDPFDLLGLYQGVAVGEKSVDLFAGGPDMIFLYRRPILDYWCAHDEKLETVVVHVMVHEIGHHFGLSDADMSRIEATVAEAAPSAALH